MLRFDIQSHFVQELLMLLTFAALRTKFPLLIMRKSDQTRILTVLPLRVHVLKGLPFPKLLTLLKGPTSSANHTPRASFEDQLQQKATVILY